MTDHTRAIEAGARADLLPCPFCGSDDIIIADNVEVFGQSSDQVYARCNKCGTNGPSAYTDPNALAKWNKRASGALVPVSADECLVPKSDRDDLDEVCRELGIQDSEVTPAQAVRELNAEIERLPGPASAVATVLRPLLGALEKDYVGDVCKDEDPAESVALGTDGKPSALTFGMIYDIQKLLRQLDTAPASGDYVVAPREPTGEQLAAGRDVIQSYLPRGEVARPVNDQWQIARETYTTMLNAASSNGGAK